MELLCTCASGAWLVDSWFVWYVASILQDGLTFDYDEFEYDLPEQDQQFACACTATTGCRGKIMGRVC